MIKEANKNGQNYEPEISKHEEDIKSWLSLLNDDEISDTFESDFQVLAQLAKQQHETISDLDEKKTQCEAKMKNLQTSLIRFRAYEFELQTKIDRLCEKTDLPKQK